MTVFAWILWSIYILMFTIHFSIFIGGIIAINEGRDVKFNINIVEIIINIAVFVFLNIYLFG